MVYDDRDGTGTRAREVYSVINRKVDKAVMTRFTFFNISYHCNIIRDFCDTYSLLTF